MATGITKDSSYTPLFSTETKPTTAKEGSVILEIDTGDVYFWHVKDNVGAWRKLGEAL